MVKALFLLPVVAALSTADSNSTSKPLAAIAKWSRPHKGGVCWSRTGSTHTNHHVAMLFQNPGAGMTPKDIEPFDRIRKDGYMKVDCIKDAMLTAGDKFGPNKHDYKYGATSNVSIVHYNAHVPKEDREKMTPEVCFNFCRTLDQMVFFGITNGRDCYCEPYFKQMAGGSSECDAMCDGDTSQTCGGKSKSNVWEMHMCNDDAQKLAELSFNCHQVKHRLDSLIPKSLKAAKGKNELGQTLQDAFGKAGDPAAGELMQKAKGAAGDLEHLAEDAKEARDKMKKVMADADALTGFRYGEFAANMAKDMGSIREAVTDFMNEDKIEKFLEFETAKKSQELLADLKEQLPKVQKLNEELGELYLLSEPVVSTTLFMHSGDCLLDTETNCITPFKHLAHYYEYEYGYYHYTIGEETMRHQSNAHCDFEILGGEADVEIKGMDLEPCCDDFTINGQKYTGSEQWSPERRGLGDKITASGHIIFDADSSCERTGFEVCVSVPKSTGESKNEGAQYYPIMYFVDKEYVNVAQTCTGDLVGSPIYFKNYDGCAAACDAHNQECVGFAYFPTGSGKPNMCFLFSKFTEVQYYTGCDEDAVVTKKSFLQKVNSTQPVTEEPSKAICAAKLSKFVGTNLTPDPSGKNKFKLKELTKADRCYTI